jgi:hypothetical protein
MVLVLLSLSLTLGAETISADLRKLTPRLEELRNELGLIEKEAQLPPGTLHLDRLQDAPRNVVNITCQKDAFVLKVAATDGEKTATMFKGLRELGFLFPHPRVQISPTREAMRRQCGKTFEWRPAVKYRGFHLHNLHPNEWVHGFYMNRPDVAMATIRWLARNGQNLIDMNLVRLDLNDLSRQMTPLFELAHSLEIHTGVSLGLSFTQQKSYKLISLWDTLTGIGVYQKIEVGLKKLFKALPLTFIVIEKGTSEFTPSGYESTVKWLNFAARRAKDENIALLTKIHVSTNQVHEKWGNFNFVTRFSDPLVGAMVHTVMFYGLLDEKTPIYGNKTFDDLRNFMLEERTKRPTWYYPETSYWIGMDIDIPLFLTDYFYTRAQDYKLLHDSGVEGHLNFTTGHALGGWMLDWNLALIADLDHQFDPLTAVRLLGEPVELWQEHMSFQHEWFKRQGLIAPLSAANLQDELSESDRIHDRNTMRQLSRNRSELEREIMLLEKALKLWPSWTGVKNLELKALLEVTNLRHQHALQLRYALLNKDQRKQHIEEARRLREIATGLVKDIAQNKTSYPDLPLFEIHKNPTSYQFGYAYLALAGYWWLREETQVRDNSYFPFWGNIFDVWNILF